MELIEQVIALFFERQNEFWDLTFEHLELTIASVLIAGAIAIPLGVAFTLSRRAAAIGIGTANVLQSLPCVALLAFAVPFVGIGAPAAVLMVVVYALLPILKNTCTGVSGVDPKLREVARGMGMTRLHYLRAVALPIAAPQIMAGVRIAAVASVGTMTIAAFAGAGGLGWYINLGLNAQNTALVLLGAIPSSLMAIGMDWLLGRIEALIAAKPAPKNNPAAVRRRRIAVALASAASLALVMLPVGHAVKTIAFSSDEKPIVVGASSFTEGIILGNILSELIEAKTDLTVDRRLNLNGEGYCYSALENGSIDVTASYSGSVAANFLHLSLKSHDPQAVYDDVKSGLLREKKIAVSAPIGFSNTYVLATSPEAAQKYGLQNLSDLMAVSQSLRIGATITFLTREDGVPALLKHYNAKPFKESLGLDQALRYEALKADEIDVIDAYSTDGLVDTMPVVLMKDADHFFPPYDAFAMMRTETLEAHPSLKGVMDALDGLINESVMRRMNYLVDVEGENAADVARAFLAESGLLPESMKSEKFSVLAEQPAAR